jgi:hypothetical protein
MTITAAGGIGRTLVRSMVGLVVPVVLLAGCGQTVLLRSPSQALCDRPPNGCGPGGILGDVVPECPVAGVCFSDACGAHDLCYRVCDVGQSVCDGQLLDDLLAACDDGLAPDHPQRTLCRNAALIYALAVEALGSSAYDVVQWVGCACEGRPIGLKRADAGSDSPLERESLCPPFVDDDGDLLPDDWEDAVGLDSQDAADSRADFDGDGRINLIEYVLQSDPFVRDSRPPVGDVSVASDVRPVDR